MELCFMDGNQAISWGAKKAGCNFFAGYPITPATSIFNMMLTLLPPEKGICLQGEDEIASIGFCLGASMAGHKAMTATSGPGISLYSEQISFAAGSEIPLVIVDVQRLGPSTGSATKGADGDIQFLNWNSSGGLPMIVLSPVDVKDCYELTVHAFNLSEEYRCPVFIAANKEVSLTRETVDLSRLEIPPVRNRPAAEDGKAYKPFDADLEKPVPDFLPIGSQSLVRQTSSTHGIEGYITKDPDLIRKTQERLDKKIRSGIDTFTFYDEVIRKNSEILIITYGVTARASKAAAQELEQQGMQVSVLVLKTLWPVPEEFIRERAAGFRRIIVPEMNLGQYAREIERVLCDKHVESFGQMNGELVKPSRIKEVIENG
ncbi:MAG: transketolase C-terminal domain-containing protein [Desulfobacteraceae bacterium]